MQFRVSSNTQFYFFKMRYLVTPVKIFKGELKDKEIPGSKLGTTLAHDVVHELALLTDERGLIDAKSFVDVYVFFYIGFHTQISSIKLHLHICTHRVSLYL